MVPKIPNFLIFPDTDCLYVEDESNIIHGGFTKKLEEVSKICDFTLIISDVVRDEFESGSNWVFRSIYDHPGMR